MTHTSTTTPLSSSSRLQSADDPPATETQMTRSRKFQVRLIRAYLFLGTVAVVLGLYILLNPELSSSALPVARDWLRRSLADLAIFVEFYYFTLGWLLLFGGALLLVGGSLVAFLLRKERRAWNRPIATK